VKAGGSSELGNFVFTASNQVSLPDKVFLSTPLGSGILFTRLS